MLRNWSLSRANFLFDASNRPLVAYGTMQLTADYFGPLFRVVRASDSATLDVVQRADGRADIAALTAFLSGTTGKVSIAYDHTGGGNHATQVVDANRPVINLEVLLGGGLAITFPGGCYMDIPVAIAGTTQNMHAFGVFEPALSYSHESCLFQLGNTAVAASQGYLSQESTTYLGWMRANPGSVATTVAPDARPSTYSYHMGTNAQGGLYFYQNDETLSAVETPAVAFSGGRIGDTQAAAAHSGKFFFGCLLLYPRQTPAFDAAMHVKMAALYTIRITPLIRRIIVDGDSIGGAYTASLQNYGIFQRANRLMPQCRIYNISRNGFQLQNTIADYANTVGALLARFGGSNCAVISQRSYNDFDAGGRTSAQFTNDLQTFGGSVLATGAKFVPMVTTPNGLGGAPGVQLATARQWVRDNYVAQGWHGIIDVTVDPTYGAYNIAYEPDLIHPIAAPCQGFAPYVANTMAPIL